NRTFLNTTNFDAFFVSNININSTQNCRAVNLYNSTGASSEDFQEVLLLESPNFILPEILPK
ncbi:MAG: hypothetical protein ACP5N1_04050, partial [Candidatus Woesearchaeota archaeon]